MPNVTLIFHFLPFQPIIMSSASFLSLQRHVEVSPVSSMRTRITLQAPMRFLRLKKKPCQGSDFVYKPGCFFFPLRRKSIYDLTEKGWKRTRLAREDVASTSNKRSFCCLIYLGILYYWRHGFRSKCAASLPNRWSAHRLSTCIARGSSWTPCHQPSVQFSCSQTACLLSAWRLVRPKLWPTWAFLGESTLGGGISAARSTEVGFFKWLV